MTDKIKAQLHQMIADGKTGGVVQQLLEITQYFGDEKLEGQAADLFNDYNAYKQKVAETSEEEQTSALEKINQRVIALLDTVPAQGQAPTANVSANEGDQNRSSWWKPVLILIIIVVLLYLVLS